MYQNNEQIRKGIGRPVVESVKASSCVNTRVMGV